MRILIAAFLVVLFLVANAQAATDVWLFYGAGPHGFSQGVDQIAARMRRFATVHGPYDYQEPSGPMMRSAQRQAIIRLSWEATLAEWPLHLPWVALWEADASTFLVYSPPCGAGDIQQQPTCTTSPKPMDCAGKPAD